MLAPGPNHDPENRSLLVKLVPEHPHGFIDLSPAGDDWRNFRDYVRQKLGEPAWVPKREGKHKPARPRPTPLNSLVASYVDRDADGANCLP